MTFLFTHNLVLNFIQKKVSIKSLVDKKNRLQMQPIFLVTPAGFKPATAGAEIQCSIQLSYGAIAQK